MDRKGSCRALEYGVRGRDRWVCVGIEVFLGKMV